MAADDTFIFLLSSFEENRLDVSCEEDSHELSSFIFSKKTKKKYL